MVLESFFYLIMHTFTTFTAVTKTKYFLKVKNSCRHFLLFAIFFEWITICLKNKLYWETLYIIICWALHDKIYLNNMYFKNLRIWFQYTVFNALSVIRRKLFMKYKNAWMSWTHFINDWSLKSITRIRDALLVHIRYLSTNYNKLLYSKKLLIWANFLKCMCQ